MFCLFPHLFRPEGFFFLALFLRFAFLGASGLAFSQSTLLPQWVGFSCYHNAFNFWSVVKSQAAAWARQAAGLGEAGHSAAVFCSPLLPLAGGWRPSWG